MGVPNSQVLVSEKDVNDTEERDEKEEDKEKRRRRVSGGLKIEIPSKEELEEEEEEGELKTPTSRVHRISEMLQCPAAPRKPKSIPSRKRKGCGFLLDLSAEIESLFPTPILLHLGGNIKKVKQPM